MKDHHLKVPEIPLEDQERLVLIPLDLSEEHGWKKLDDQSAWQQFSWEKLQESQRVELLQARQMNVGKFWKKDETDEEDGFNQGWQKNKTCILGL